MKNNGLRACACVIIAALMPLTELVMAM